MAFKDVLKRGDSFLDPGEWGHAGDKNTHDLRPELLQDRVLSKTLSRPV